jgi:YrbI family 3-deoxy-D-manno-octulosonate 8-phosphate phosphatase
MIKFVIFDFDGVFTDNKCYFDGKNNIIKYYDIKDGMALSLLKKNNIKIGLISSYNTKLNLQLNENNINQEMIEHLNFDYKYIGSCNKLEILEKWMKELNINFNEIAYIGDDVNDIPILEKVKFSACPNDAIDKCKEVVKYICKNNGGNGCIREFVDIVIENNINTNLIQEIRKNINYQLDNFNINEIEEIANIINTKNNIYFTGIGKSKNMANHLCDLLKSISINSFYLDSVNALHGDIGTITDKDLIFLFSKSGNTIELINLIPFLKNRNCYTIGICCDNNSVFEKICDKIIKLPFNKEIDGEINQIPTNSCMSQLLFSNILVSLLKKNININKYKENHNSGNIGNKLKKIKDCLIFDFPKILIQDEIKLYDILFKMTKYKVGACFFVNEIDELIGILTDGDIRRLLLLDENKKIITINDINTNYYYETDLDKFIIYCKKISYVPVLNDKKLIGILNLII